MSTADALEDVRVLDFTAVMAGPFATRMMADLGARVLKIESLDGDQVRARPPLRDGYSAYFGHLNAGKRSLACNLKSSEIRSLILQLVEQYDVLVENFRPGVMQRFGLDYETLSAINPRLIYCSISGYGQKGPKAHYPAYAPVIHATSGFDMAVLHYQQDGVRPATTGIFVADVLGGAYAFGAIQTALYQREKTGRGQQIDVSMLESMLSMLVFETQAAKFPGTPARPLYTPLKTLDGFLMVAPTSPANFLQLCKALNRPEWKEDARFSTVAARNANWAELLAAVEEWTKVRTSEDAEALLMREGVPCARYRELSEALEDSQLAARRAYSVITDGAGSYTVPNPPFHMSETRAEARGMVSALGQHGAEVLQRELGLSADDVARLQAAGVLGRHL